MTAPTPPVSAGRDALRALLDAAVADGTIPGGVALVGDAERDWAPVAVGVRRYGGAPVTPDTRYDLASLTKVVGGLPALLRLLDAGEIRLSDPVRRFFSNAGWFQTPSLGDVTLEELALHRSGLPAWAPLFARTSERRTALAQVLQSPLSEPAGRFLYSDLGVIALGAVVERVAGERLDDFLQREVFVPLGMRATGYGPLDPAVPVAATEDDGLRGGVLEGQVHDENAWALGGVSAHAGLFGTAEDLLSYGRAWLRGALPFAGDGWRREALRDRSGGDGPRRGLLWRLAEPGWLFGDAVTGGGAAVKGGDADAGGGPTAARAFGHTGFTGTSLVVDPGQGWVAVLLTNRVHPSRACGAGIARLRKDVHDVVAAAYAAEARA